MVYNPLDKKNLARSVGEALLATEPQPLSAVGLIEGAGVYALYYTGRFAAYQNLSARNMNGQFLQPIYVGKAVPVGARKGVAQFDASRGKALRNRLEEHAESIRQAGNTIAIEDFWFRALVVDDIWIPLGESVLIQMFRPIWNHVIDGFGNHDPGAGRHQSKVSPWDTLHPGRTWAARLQGGPRLSREQVLERIMETERLAADSANSKT